MSKSKEKIQWPTPRTVALPKGQQSTGGILYRVKTPDGKIHPFNNQEDADAFINRTLQENPTYYSDLTDNNASNNQNTIQRKDSSPKTSNQKPITQQSTQQQETPTQPSQPTSNPILKNLSFTYNTPEWARPFNRWTNENIPWLNKGMTSFSNFVNDEILLNKDNIRAKNAHDNPEIMDKIQEGGNIAGYSVLAAAGLPAVTEAAIASAPTIMNGLNIAGQALTPSTWIDGIASAAGYQAPSWILNGADLAASLYFANEAGKEIDKNGLNLKTGINALLSLSPMTRSPKAAEAVAYGLRNPSKVINSVADDFRAVRNAFSSPEAALGRELSRSIKNTKFINVPVEHVSLNGMTKGSALDAGKEGIHLSPVGSYTTPQIETYFLNQGKVPFVRTGTWTYSTNTKPVEVQDVGYFGRGFNSDFDAKVDNGVTNFFYTNNFEGNGNTSYLTMRPSFGLQLSKNTQNSKKIDWNTPASITSDGYKLADGTLTPSLRTDLLSNYFERPISFAHVSIEGHPELGHDFRLSTYSQNGRDYSIGENSNKSIIVYRTPEDLDYQIVKIRPWQSYNKVKKKVENLLLESRRTFIESLPDDEIKDIVRRQLVAKEKDRNVVMDDASVIEGTRLGDLFKGKIKNDIEDIYLSDEYITRYMKSLGLSPEDRIARKQIKDQISQSLNSTYNKAIPIFYRDSSTNAGLSNAVITSSGVPIKFRFGFNGNADQPFLMNDWTSTLFHEFGHNIWNDTTPFSDNIRNYNSMLVYDNFTPLNLTDLAFKPEYKDYVKYLRNPSEFRQRIMEGVRYGIKEGLTPEEIYQQCPVQGFEDLKYFFKKDYLIKMLGLMLGTTPAIINTKANDKTS